MIPQTGRKINACHFLPPDRRDPPSSLPGCGFWFIITDKTGAAPTLLPLPAPLCGKEYCIMDASDITVLPPDPDSKDNALLPARFITDKAVLADPDDVYADSSRRFQGIPGIERTQGGCLYTVFYTGTEKEGNGNFLLVHRSRDGVDFSETIMAVVPPSENTRCYDPCLWIAPDKKLRLFWAQSCGWFDGRCGVWCSVCENPDDAQPRFSPPRRIANGIMMNKPTALSTGEWLLPCAIWKVAGSRLNDLPEERFSNVYCSADSGNSYTLLGHSDYPDRHFDEHMI